MKNLMIRLWKEEEGQDLTEYALLLVLLSLAAVASLSALATAINKVFSQAVTNIREAYGLDLPLLRDSDGDGFPDVMDLDPKTPGYKTGKD